MKGLDVWDILLLIALMGFKMIPGVALALYYRLDWWTQFIITGVGGSAGIIFFTYLGDAIRRLINRIIGHRHEQKDLNNRWQGRLWKKYGIWGAAVLTPPILSPPVGTTLALAFGTQRKRIVVVYVFFVWIWSFIFTQFGQWIISLL